VLRLKHLRPGGVLCFVFFEGAIALGILMTLAELVSSWIIVLLPLTVAVAVKFNDVVAGAIAVPRAAIPRTGLPGHALSEATVGSPRGWADPPVPEEEPANPSGRGTIYGSPVHEAQDEVAERGSAVGPQPDRAGSPEQRARQSGASRYE
jgi:hypothetical protein